MRFLENVSGDPVRAVAVLTAAIVVIMLLRLVDLLIELKKTVNNDSL